MRTPTARVKPKVAQTALFPAPVAGLIANRAKAMTSSAQAKLPPGATILENWFPTATSIRTRRGSARYATLGLGDLPTRSLFTYTLGGSQKLFGATDTTIYDLTVVNNAFNDVVGDEDAAIEIGDLDDEIVIGTESTIGLEVLEGQTGGQWITVQTTNTDGGTFLRGVNGMDTPFVYDGLTFSTTPALTFDVGDETTPQQLSYVWQYKRRLFFIKKGTLDAYYLPVSAIGGELALLPLGAVFTLGGALMFGASWSLGTSDQGGLSAQCVFVTTEGEVAVYQGDNPDDPAAWSLVGVYRIGKPLGPQAHMAAGGDIVIATTIGFLPLSEAVQREYAALAPAAVSNPIEDAWREAVQRRGTDDWNVILWPDGQMVLVASPPPATTQPQVFVANSNTGAWCYFSGWDARCFVIFRGGVYFGGADGAVTRGWVTGADDGASYTCRYLGLFEDGGTPAQRKIVGFARATLMSSVAVITRVSVNFDYRETLPQAPNAASPTGGNVWDAATWDQSIWDAEGGNVITSKWVSVGGSGARLAPAVQVTSGSAIPLDVELTGVDMSYTLADVIT